MKRMSLRAVARFYRCHRETAKKRIVEVNLFFGDRPINNPLTTRDLALYEGVTQFEVEKLSKVK